MHAPPMAYALNDHILIIQILSTVFFNDMNGKIYGALVQFGCYQNRHNISE